jgi:hypothetical protein
MANKLAGQRAKFSRARAIFYTSGDEKQRQRAAQLMAEVLAEAPANGFLEGDVTQCEDVPSEARGLATTVSPGSDENPEDLIHDLRLSVETSNVRELGQGEQFVYAYGYPCAPDRLKLGSCAGDVVARIAAQISTGTPDKPVLLLKIATHDCRALERALHAIFRLKGRQVAGAGAEWFIATPEEVVAAYERVTG